MTIHDLRRRDAPEVTPAEYPDTWPFEGNELPIQYRFEPGAPDDGATVTVAAPVAGGRDTGVVFSADPWLASREDHGDPARPAESDPEGVRARAGHCCARGGGNRRAGRVSTTRWLSGSPERADP